MPTAAELPGFFRLQARSCATSPAYVALFEALARLAEREPAAFEQLLEAWRGRTFVTFYAATLNLAASLHRAFLERDPAGEPLRGAFEVGATSRGATTGAAATSGPDLTGPALERALAHVLRAPSERMRAFWRSGEVQTNEVTRSVAWRIVADSVTLAGLGPIVLVELGTSAGLNLVRGDLGLTWEGWAPRSKRGERSTPDGKPDVVAALGIDRSPLDVRRDEDRLLLRASLWPGQVERRARLDAAMEALPRESPSVSLVAGELPGALERVEPFVREHPRAFLLVFNTIFSAYLPDPAYSELQARIGALLATRRGVWVELESPRGRPEEAHRTELAVWLRAKVPVPAAPGQAAASWRPATAGHPLERLHLADTEPHPRVLRLAPGALDELDRRLRELG